MLDSEINARFHLNEHGDLCFLLQNSSVHVILFDSKKLKKFNREEKRIQVKACTKPLLWDANYAGPRKQRLHMYKHFMSNSH